MINNADPDQLKKLTDLGLHYLQRQGVSDLARPGLDSQ